MNRYKMIGLFLITCLALVFLIDSTTQTLVYKSKEAVAIQGKEEIKEEKAITMNAKLLKDYFSYFLKQGDSYQYAGNEPQMEVTEEKATSMDTANSSHSTTNNQVQGIEEGDTVITDGRFIYSIVDNSVSIIDVKTLEIKSSIELKSNDYPSRLIIHENQLIITSTGWKETDKNGGKSITNVVIYDVTNGAKPVVLNEFAQDGDMVNVRKLDNYLYVVSSLSPNYWLLEKFPDIDLRPAVYTESGEEKLLPYDNIKMLPDANTPNYLIVSAINLETATNEVVTESFLGNSGQLYMSEEAIYIASMYYGIMPFVRSLENDTTVMPTINNMDETTIYKLTIDKQTISFIGDAKITGRILNQFSMDEHNGFFRIATTEGSAWGEEANSKNHLFILDENLKEVGAVKDLAKGERIYSARFMGDRAYLVTFKETDPLFVIDTKNPTAPKVLGELKIPGFSNYLHPIGENHLLGIGYDTEVVMEEWSKEPQVLTKGMKLSLFNVEDVNNPLEQQALIIGGRGTHSTVQYDHKALFIDESKNYFGFPVTIYEEGQKNKLKYKGTGAQIYEVTSEGMKLVADLIEPARPGEQYEDSYHTIHRILYVDDKLFTVSPWKMTSFDYESFKKLKTVGF